MVANSGKARRGWGRGLVALALALGLNGLLAAGCGHTKTVGPATSSEAQSKEDGHEGPPKDEPKHAASGGAGAGRHLTSAPPDKPHDAPPADNKPADVPLATSPAGLLKPGAEKKIQDKLADGGLLKDEHPSGSLDGATREALRKFQRQNSLPATGMPDDATIRKLGLDPGDVFRSGDDERKRD